MVLFLIYRLTGILNGCSRRPIDGPKQVGHDGRLSEGWGSPKPLLDFNNSLLTVPTRCSHCGISVLLFIVLKKWGPISMKGNFMPLLEVN